MFLRYWADAIQFDFSLTCRKVLSLEVDLKFNLKTFTVHKVI